MLISMPFEEFPKIARFKKEMVITEKLDGTNCQVALFPLEQPGSEELVKMDPYCIGVVDTGLPFKFAVYAGSRNRWIAPEGTVGLGKGCDNFTFAKWVKENLLELAKLGEGKHYGEWYGIGIQRTYGLTEKRLALFNTARWGKHNPNTPACCEVVTVINAKTPEEAMMILSHLGSAHVPDFMNPEGIVIYHTGSRTMYKQTFEKDEGKWVANVG